MILHVYASNEKNAMSESYKELITNLKCKNKHIVMIPYVYDINSFSNQYGEKVKEEFTKCSKIRYRLELIKFLFKLYNICKNNNVKKVFLYHTGPYTLYFRLLINLLKLEVCVMIHDPILHSGEGIRSRFYRKCFDKLIMSNVDKVLVTYGDAVKIINDKYNIDHNKVKVVWLPQMKSMEYIDIKNSNNSCFYDCIFFGRIEEYKGIDILLKAIKYVEYKYKYSLKVVIAGKGSESENVKNLINDEKLSIEFINEYVDNYKLASLINSSKLVILPYKDATGTQTVQIANYYNKPVIVNSVGCFKEYVENDINGIKIEEINYEKLGDCIYNFIVNNKKYNDLKNNINIFFNDNFLMDKYIESIEDELIK